MPPRDSPQPNVGHTATAGLDWRFWALVPLLGAGAGLCAGLLMKLLRLVQQLAWPAYVDNFLLAVDAASDGHRILVLAGAGLLVAGLRWALAQPTGGHTAELTATIWFHAGRLPLARTLLRAVESIVIVGLGASLGREAGPKQAGAAVASAMGLASKLPPGRRRLLVAFGAGAGIAAVYNVPFGGALFALEVLLGTLALPLVAPALATSVIATATAWLLLGNHVTYQFSPGPLSMPLLAWSAIAGPAAGILSVFYIRLISWSDAVRPTTTAAMLVTPVITFILIGLLSIGVPQLLGNGKDLVQLALSGAVPLATLALVTILKPLATAACLGSGAPGGLFTPTLTLGASFGGLLGYLGHHVGVSAPAGVCALIGAVTVLAASMQGPVSAIVLVIELTNHSTALLAPIILAVSEAVLVTRVFESRSIYSGRIQRGRAVAERGGSAASPISSAARYIELVQALVRAEDHQTPLLVLDERGELIGQIRPEHIRCPDRRHQPLETATARDFISDRWGA